MNINMVWDNNEQNVMRVTFAKVWSWDEFDAIVEQAQLMMDEVHHQVDVIIDMRESGAFPERAFWRFHKLINTKHHNRGRVIVVGGNSFIRTLTDTLQRLASDLFDAETFLLVSTIEEARASLFRRRIELVSGY